jgi:hypothetical protein
MYLLCVIFRFIRIAFFQFTNILYAFRHLSPELIDSIDDLTIQNRTHVYCLINYFYDGTFQNHPS